MRAVARVNLAAVERNLAVLRAAVGAGVEIGAVVKAEGYGHGAVPVARAALAGGASWLMVATAGEAAALRAGGLNGVRVLVLGALDEDDLEVALRADADVVAWDEAFTQAVAARATRQVGVHVKLDTGMGRLGTREAAQARRVVEQVLGSGGRLRLAGLMTHFATADDDQRFLAKQLDRFRRLVEELRAAQPDLTVHAANSAATLGAPQSHFDLVRCGISIYGGDPFHEDPRLRGLEPVMELRSRVAAVKAAHPGDSVGYGRRWVAERETLVATVPIGYGDGVRRSFSNNMEILVGRRRLPLIGTVSMDNITLEVGPEGGVAQGDEVVLLGAAGDERVTAEELARRIGTINYEVFCGISGRVPRLYHRDGGAV